MAAPEQTVNEHLMDAAIRHQIGLQRLSTATVRKIVALLNRADADIVNQLVAAGPGARTDIGRRRLERMLDAIRDIIKEAYGEVHPTMRAELTQLAAYEAEFMARAIQTAVPIKIDVIAPTAESLAAAVNSRPFEGRLLREWAQDLEADAFRKLRDQIRIGFVQGETIDQMVRRVRGNPTGRRVAYWVGPKGELSQFEVAGWKKRFFQDYSGGVLNLNRRNAEAVVRTAVAHTASSAREELFRANADLVKEVLWDATLDRKTTPICRARDGKRYSLEGKPLGHDNPWFGGPGRAHWQCRSHQVPIIKSWKELGIDLAEAPEGTRAALNGQVPASTTYGEWLRRQDREFVEDVLGKTKAKLFLDGDLPIDSFVDDLGKEWILKDLRQREEKAFEAAGLS